MKNFFEAFHTHSKQIFKGEPLSDPATWPVEWSTTYYKTYSRFPKILLPKKEESSLGGIELEEAIRHRVSDRDFNGGSVSLQNISILLRYACGIMDSKLSTGRRRRVCPSGGARYPLEVYPVVLQEGEDVSAGLYHYDVFNHALDTLWEREFSDEYLNTLLLYPWSRKAGVVFLITGIFWRTHNKYGDRGYRHAVLEAGHVGQNIYLVSQALGLKCCAIAGVFDDTAEKLLDIDGVTESLVYALAVGT